MSPAEQVHCSFCGKAAPEVRKIIAGPGIYICDECVALCVEILRLDDGVSRPALPDWSDVPTEELLTRLPRIARVQDQVDEGLRRLVDELRRRKVAWATIGEALGLSRQTVWERFSARGRGLAESDDVAEAAEQR
ncbi:MAG: hypothetical protein HOW97_22735 [Catenulispora sp.]|nr:hypothetical protein [Catenulispora sp.]